MKNALFITAFLLILPFITVSPQKAKSYPTDVETVLQKAKGNRKELELFLNYCKESNDSLKWKAACFLVSNMDIHYSENFYWADSLQRKVSFNELDFSNYSLSKKAFNELNAKSKLHPIKSKVYDMQIVKADFLIQNLEYAFSAWQNSKSSYLNFEEFCEYLLPYRSLIEQLECWRPQYADTFKTKNENISTHSVLFSTNKLSQKIGGYFASTYNIEDKNNPISFLSPSQLLFRKLGHCEDEVNFTNMVFRSQGLACRIEMIPYHATSTGRHYWNATIDENHEVLPFESTKVVEEFNIPREPSKVVTFTYGKQQEVPGNLVEESEIPDNYLRNLNYKDVTDLYWRTKDLHCELAYSMNKKLAYIAVFNGLQWCPAYWGKIINNSEVTFPKMSCGVVYLPMLYINGKLKPAAYPRLVFDSKEETILKPNKEKLHTIILNEQEKYLRYRVNKRYKLFYWDSKWELIDEKLANDQPQLSFENVPTNALLLLVPEYSSRKERPFIIDEKGERMWW